MSKKTKQGNSKHIFNWGFAQKKQILQHDVVLLVQGGSKGALALPRLQVTTGNSWKPKSNVGNLNWWIYKEELQDRVNTHYFEDRIMVRDRILGSTHLHIVITVTVLSFSLAATCIRLVFANKFWSFHSDKKAFGFALSVLNCRYQWYRLQD